MSRAEVVPTNLRNSLRFKEFSRNIEMIFEEASYKGKLLFPASNRRQDTLLKTSSSVTGPAF
jgi:hypothetical protein